MSIQDESILLDTNIWIFGLRRAPDFSACAELLNHLNQLRVILPRQILQELQANLTRRRNEVTVSVAPAPSEAIPELIGRRLAKKRW